MSSSRIAGSDLTPFQVGTLVADIDRHLELYRTMGVVRCVDSGWTAQGRYYDARLRRMVQPRARMALGRLSGDVCLELIDVDRSGDVPWAWDAALVGTTSHVGHWTNDVAASGRRLTEVGAVLVTARGSAAAGPEDQLAEALATHQRPAGLAMAYLKLGDGLLVELVSTELWDAPLKERFGPEVTQVVAPPSVTS